jgi:poly(3-hydroxybutyrate) depolymerase
MPGRFAAIAPVAAVDLTDEPIGGEHLGVFHVHGRVDGLVPFHDRAFRLANRLGGLGWTRSARESLRRFARHIGALEPKHHVERNRRYEVWRGAAGHVAQLVLHGGGHTWLGDGYRIAKQYQDAVAEGSREIVRFFLDHRRR